VTFDLIGRLPTLSEQEQFAASALPEKDHELVERLLADPSFGANWANYWSDTIAYRVPPPELTYLNYGPLKTWLAARLNANAPWSQIASELITAAGSIDENPPATFVGYHQAEPTNLAGETSRIFLGQQIGCAQCHDHPFDRWKRSQFHELAAFFARSKVKLSQNDGRGTVVSAIDKGEYLLPDMADPRKKGSPLRPALLDGAPVALGLSDAQRRAQLASWVTSPDNPWFAKAFTNRIWSRLMGVGFYEPVDDLGAGRSAQLGSVHDATAGHFTATGFDIKDLFRLITLSESYRRAAAGTLSDPATAPPRLRGDEVFAALAVGIELPNVTPPATPPTAAVRFPPPPKSTCALVTDAFGADPSLSAADAPRTMQQAMWMMNNAQLQKQIDATPDSGTMLARLLVDEPDDAQAAQQLFTRVLARRATADELRITLAHIVSVGERRSAFEDLLWSLVNSAEFTTRR
jgi:hypothetical protein